ncbi:MAG: hypothetical protein HYZ38_00490 [Mycobacterium sp.]|nr:hypothetical protein [Mycobacterium sp.]
MNTSTTTDGAVSERLPAKSATTNWVLALLTLPAAAAVVGYAFVRVMGMAACTTATCPRMGPGELGFTAIVYGTPAVAIAAVLLSFVTARKPRGIAVPVIAWLLIIIAAAAILLTFP